MAESVILKAPCNSCLNLTNHVVVAEKKAGWADDPCEYCYQILACRGCDTVRFRQEITLPIFSDDTGEPRKEISYFPAAVSRRRPKWLHDFSFDVDAEIQSLLNEIYVAIHEDLRVLAGNGIRTILDMVMTRKVGDVGDFAAKLSAVENAGLVSKSNREFLEVTIKAGSASAHRGFKPTQTDLNLLLDITENLISSIYVLPGEVKSLSERVPSRAQRKREK